jgi:protein required for attachment to host cells
LRRDAFGRRGGSDLRMGGNATSSAGEEKLDHEAERFARRVAERLAEAQRQRRYSQLRIAAAPKFLGRLRKVLDSQVEQAVVDEIDKDLLQLDRRSLTERFFPSPPTGGS